MGTNHNSVAGGLAVGKSAPMRVETYTKPPGALARNAPGTQQGFIHRRYDA